MVDLTDLEAMQQGQMTELLYGDKGDVVPLSPEQMARPHGYYWVRDRVDELWFPWRIDEWIGRCWLTCGEEVRGDPDEVGPQAKPPA